MILNLDETLTFKAAMAQRGIVIHLHDTCGGQYFSLDETCEAVKAAIEEYFRAVPGARPVFQPDGLGFYLPDQ